MFKGVIMSKICNKCGKENPENLIFCESCGSLLMNVQEATKGSAVLRDDFERVFRDYLPQRKKYVKTSAPIAYFIKEDLLTDFTNLVDSHFTNFGTNATVGHINLAHCPQLFFWGDYGCDLGLMFMFIFKGDMSGVYLSMRYSGRKDPDESLKTKRDVYQYCIKKHYPDIEFLESIDLASNTDHSISYEKSTILSKYYSKDSIPDDDVLIKDMKDFFKCAKLLCELKPLNDEELVEMITRKSVENEDKSGAKMSKICKNCGKEVDNEFDFCVYCGEKLPKHLICPDCEKEYFEVDYGYCGKCGGKLVDFVDFKNKSSFVLKEDFEKVFSEYLPQRRVHKKVSAPIAYFIREDLKNDFINLIDGEFPYTEIYPSTGIGYLAHCPQLSFQTELGGDLGLHFVYIFKADMSGVYLSMRYLGRLDSDRSLKIKRDVYQYCIKTHFPKFEFLKSIDLESNTSFSKSYEKSTIISKFYSKGNIPSDDVLIEDIKEFIECGKLLCDLKPLDDEELVKKVMGR